jgi:uncharacterized protein DUF4349
MKTRCYVDNNWFDPTLECGTAQRILAKAQRRTNKRDTGSVFEKESMMRFRFVISRSVLAAGVTASLLLSLACEKRAALMVRGRDSSASSAYFRVASPGGGGGGDRQHLVAEQTEAAPAAPAGRKIVRNGSLELLVADVGQTASKIRAIVDDMGGFVEKSAQTNTGGHTAVITARVPAGSLDRLMAEVKKLALTIDRENVEARDVTRDYVDLDARLRNAHAEEAQYLQILKRATTVKDTLEGAEKLSSVRGRIEQLQGEMKYLTTQIDMSSLEISLRGEAGATVLGIHWRPLRQAKVALGDMISGLADWADSVIAFFINLPLIVVWLVSVLALVVIAIRVLRFCWRKLGPKTGWRLPWQRSRPSNQASPD